MATLAETYPEQAMPRERLLQVGAEGCSDAELLAILLRTGTKEVNVVELATKITKEFGNLYELKTATIDELCRTSGIGTAKAIQVKAALELGARMHRALQPKIGRVRSSADLAYSLMDELRDKPQEHLLCIYLNTKNEIIHKQVLFIGSLNQSVAISMYEKNQKFSVTLILSPSISTRLTTFLMTDILSETLAFSQLKSAKLSSIANSFWY